MTKRSHNPGEDGKGDHLRRQMDELASRVPKHALRAVIDEIDSTNAQNSARAQTLRGVLVEQFNKLRPFKARRLFTGLFEPLLVDDPVLYRARDPIPGLIQRVDMGGVWHALVQFAFPETAMWVQGRLDALSQDELLDRVLVSREAMVMRDQMRDEALRFLTMALKTRRTAEEFLIFANREALRDARQRSPYLTWKAPIDVALLGFLRSVLAENAAVLPLMERMRQDLSDTPAGGGGAAVEVDGQAAIIVGFMRSVRMACPNRDADDPLVWLPPLLMLNVKRRYDVVLRYVREYGGPPVSDSHPLHQGIFGHFSACCTTMTELIRAAFGEVAAGEGHALTLSRPVRETLDESRRRFEQSLNTINASGLMATRQMGPRVRTLLSDLTRLLTGMVLPLLVERTQSAATARNAPAPDHEDLVWLLEFVWAWGATLGTVGYASPEIASTRSRIVENAGIAFIQASKAEDDDETLPARMDHIIRINRLLGALGADIGPWVSAVSQGLQRVVRHYLEGSADISPEALFVIDRLIAAIRTELGRSRHWQSADLVGLLRLYEARME